MTVQEQLLDAIGGIEEELLLKPNAPSIRRIRVGLIAAVVAIMLACSAFAAEFLYGKTDMDNMITGSGRFLFHDGQIFFEEPYQGILALNTQNRSVNTISTQDTGLRSLFILNGRLGYVRGFQDVVLQKEDSIGWDVLFSGSYPRMHLDGSFLYSDNGMQLQRTDLATGEATVLANDTHGYFVDEEYLYVLAGGRGNVFLRSRKDAVSFEEIPLSFYPAAIYVDGEDIYLSRYAALAEGEPNFRVIHYRDGVETPLPIYSSLLQAVGNTIYYLQNNTLKTYNTDTGAIEILQDRVFEFSILEERYLCITYLYDRGTEIQDLNTNATLYPANRN